MNIVIMNYPEDTLEFSVKPRYVDSDSVQIDVVHNNAFLNPFESVLDVAEDVTEEVIDSWIHRFFAWLKTLWCFN